MSQHPPFRPFETLIDEAAALAILRAATDGAEDGELFLERQTVFLGSLVNIVFIDGLLGFAFGLSEALLQLVLLLLRKLKLLQKRSCRTKCPVV